MIYSSSVNYMNESDIDSLLENANDRFEYETMAEATAIIIKEQEENWTRFMTGIGLSELSSVMEGQEVIYEGARLQKLFEKAKAYFKVAMNKLAEITKAFIAKIDQVFRTNASFVKKYKSKLTAIKAEQLKGFEFKGYNFPKTLDTAPVYDNGEVTKLGSDDKALKASINGGVNSNNYTPEFAEKHFITLQGGKFENSVAESLTKLYFGDNEKELLDNISITEQIGYVESVKGDKDKAKKSYTNAHKLHKQIISKLEADERKALNDKDGDHTNDAAFNILIQYWKTWSNASTTCHGTYMRALGVRARQAKAICVKALNYTNRETGKAKREKMKAAVESGYADADAFLGAVEFI